jgi:hypothetical protein
VTSRRRRPIDDVEKSSNKDVQPSTFSATVFSGRRLLDVVDLTPFIPRRSIGGHLQPPAQHLVHTILPAKTRRRAPCQLLDRSRRVSHNAQRVPRPVVLVGRSMLSLSEDAAAASSWRADFGSRVAAGRTLSSHSVSHCLVGVS